MKKDDPGCSRRDFLDGATRFISGAGLVLTVGASTAHATPETMLAAIKSVIGDAALRKGKVKLEVPPLVENGNSVTTMVSVDSPMTAENYVRTIHVFNEKNPQPNVIGVHLGPRAGRAKFSTRIRLADTQRVIAIAQLSDGSFWSDSVDVVITLGACLEDS
jgi:sulfur-oxidizing protein SoxY